MHPRFCQNQKCAARHAAHLQNFSSAIRWWSATFPANFTVTMTNRTCKIRLNYLSRAWPMQMVFPCLFFYCSCCIWNGHVQQNGWKNNRCVWYENISVIKLHCISVGWVFIQKCCMHRQLLGLYASFTVYCPWIVMTTFLGWLIINV